MQGLIWIYHFNIYSVDTETFFFFFKTPGIHKTPSIFKLSFLVLFSGITLSPLSIVEPKILVYCYYLHYEKRTLNNLCSSFMAVLLID